MKYYSQPHRFIRHLPTYPFIFPAIIPVILLDIWVELYHRVSFPFYSIKYVKRKDYIKIDRHKLKYLNPMQKINCAYCGYVNGVARYWVRIFAETEKYWCGIQHARREGFHVPEHHDTFIPYDDQKAFEDTYRANRSRQF